MVVVDKSIQPYIFYSAKQMVEYAVNQPHTDQTINMAIIYKTASELPDLRKGLDIFIKVASGLSRLCISYRISAPYSYLFRKKETEFRVIQLLWCGSSILRGKRFHYVTIGQIGDDALIEVAKRIHIGARRT